MECEKHQIDRRSQERGPTTRVGSRELQILRDSARLIAMTEDKLARARSLRAAIRR